MAAKRKINLAFIGSGHWARRVHFPALALLAHNPPSELDLELCLHGIYSLEREAAEAVAKHYGFGLVYPSLDALIDDPQVNAVAVAVTPDALVTVAKHLINKGVPIFSEKPPGISANQARELRELVHVPNVVGFNRRFSPLNNQFKELVDKMRGIFFVEGHFLRYQRQDETFMIGTGIHWVNFMTYLFGDIQHANVTRFHTPQKDTWNWIADLSFTSGTKGLLKVFPCSGSEVERIEVHSSNQSLYLDGPLRENPGKIIIDRGTFQKIITPETSGPLPEAVRVGIVGEYIEFLTKACAGLPTRSNFQNAVNSMAVAESMQHGIDFHNTHHTED